MPIYCDESGGVGRGVMTLAGLSIDAADAEKTLARFREVTGLTGELDYRFTAAAVRAAPVGACAAASFAFASASAAFAAPATSATRTPPFAGTGGGTHPLPPGVASDPGGR